MYSVRHWRWCETPRNHVGPPEHSNPVVRCTTEIFRSKQNRNMPQKSKQLSPLAADNTRNTVPLSPFSRNVTRVCNHAGHDLLRSRSSIRSRPFHKTKNVVIIMWGMNSWGRDQPSTLALSTELKMCVHNHAGYELLTLRSTINPADVVSWRGRWSEPGWLAAIKKTR